MVRADTVFLNGKVITVDEGFSIKEAVAVKNGWIIDVDTTEEINKYVRDDTEVIDLKGKTIMPGVSDAHVHGPFWALNALYTVDFAAPKVHDIASCQEVLKEAVAKAKPGEWIMGSGIAPQNFDERQSGGKMVTCLELDEVSPDNPVRIGCLTGHDCLVNSKAMEIAGIDRNTTEPAPGAIKYDKEGNPNGHFSDAGMELINQAIPVWSYEKLEKAIMFWQDTLIKTGTVAYNDCTLGRAGNTRENGAWGERPIELYKKLYDEGKLRCRVAVGYYPGEESLQTYENVKSNIDSIPRFEDCNPNWLRLGRIKLFVDGDLEPRTIWTVDPYQDDGTNSYYGMSAIPGEDGDAQAEELHKIIKLCHDNGFQVNTHVVGDRAVTETVDSMVQAMRENPRANLRHCLSHGDWMISKDDIELCAKYGILGSCQPSCIPDFYEITIDKVGEEKGSRINNLRDMLDGGMVIAGGVDALFGDYLDWRISIQRAIERKSSVTGTVYHPELAITIEEGIRMFTMGGAYQEHQELVRGSIEPNKLADMIVLDKDILEIPVEEISNVEVLLTMIEGKVEYCKEGWR